MNQTIVCTLLLSGFLTACASETAPVDAVQDHSHASIGVTVWSEATELFIEHPPVVAGVAGDPWAIHVTRLQDFVPVAEGVLTLAFRGPDGTVFTTRAASPSFPGVFTPAPQLPAPGSYELVVDIAGSMHADRISAGQVQVYRTEADVPHEAPTDDADVINFLKTQQWPIAFQTTQVTEREIAASIAVAGDIVAAAGRIAEVASPVSGLAPAPVNMRAPAIGDRVRKGETLVSLTPTAQYDSYAQTKANVVHLNREVTRLQRLFDAEAIPEKQLIEARHDLDVAQAAFDALGASTADGFDYSLQAPISGIVQARSFTPGARIDVGQTLFKIVDLRVVWLRLRLPAQHASGAHQFGGTHFTVEGSDRVYQSERLVSAGSIIDPTTRMLPIVFAIDNSDESLKIGQIAQARLHHGILHTGIAIPDRAILMEDGLPVAYVQVGGETFERRVLTLGASDGTYTLVERGLTGNEHVVTEGAYQVYLASLNTNEISDHGHPH